MSRKNYTVSELVQDPSFRRMVKGTATSYEVDKWNDWMEEDDQNRSIAVSAISRIVGFEFNDPELPDIEKKWSDLYAKTAGSHKIQSRRRRGKETKLKWILRVAALLLVMSLAGLGGGYFYNGDRAVTHLEQLSEEKTITTAGDEQKTLRFSNGSKVVLSSNSTLTYRIGLLHNQTIDVTLEGEAWFDAVSDPSKKQPVFAVSTPDGVIRDIGTKFMVTVQKNQSRVVLQEGFIEVVPLDEENSQMEEYVRFSVQRGEMVEFNRTEILKREVVNSTMYTSWATGFIQFDRTDLREFAEYVQQRFGVKVRIVDPGLTDLTLDGAVYFRSLEGLVRAVSEVTAIPVYQSVDRDTVYIGNPND